MSADPEPLANPTVPVGVDYALDDGPDRYRIGLIALDSDVSTERDFHAMLPPGAMFYTARLHCINPITVENLRLQVDGLTDATRMLVPALPLGAVAYSCTSGTVAIGYEEVARRIRAADRADVAVVTPITSAIAGLEHLGVRRISLMTPYIDSVNQAMRAYLEARGVEVLNIGSFCLDDDREMARVPPEAIRAAAIETCRDDADALFVSCTALRAVETIESVEAAIGRPMLTSIQTLFWESIRAAGYRAAIPGFGRLLRS